MRRALVTVALAAALWPRPARAYDEDVHAFLTRSALGRGVLQAPAGPIPPGAAAAVRRAIDAWARDPAHGDAPLRAEWLRRYPTPAAFDVWAEKELLLFSPEANIWGLDRFPDGAHELRDLVEAGARQPDDDWRNRERLAYDAEHKPIDDVFGLPVPADPAILNMGKLGALSSQAHAHYGLDNVVLSDDPAVLKSDPRRFAVAAGYPPGPVLTLAAEMAQTHFDLALIAALDDAPSPELAWLYTGQGLHYVEDVSNQIHTVQVGLYDFFVDATIERLKMAARTCGGYCGQLRTLASIGVEMLTNHHVLSEQLVRKRVLDTLAGKATPEGTRLVAARPEERAFRGDLDATLPAPGDVPAAPFGEVVTRRLIEISSHEASDVYRATRTIAVAKLHRAGVEYREHTDDPDAWIQPPEQRDAAAYDRLFELQALGFMRARAAVAACVDAMGLAMAPDRPTALRTAARERAIERLVRRQLRLLSEAEARRADYLAHPKPAGAHDDRMPAMLVVEAGLLVGLAAVVLAVMNKRKRRRAEIG